MADKVKRDQIVALKTAGVSSNDIFEQLKVCRKKVYNAWKQFQESGTTSINQFQAESAQFASKMWFLQ